MLGWPDQVSIYFERKCSKVAIVDPASGLQVLFDVLTEGLENEVELRLGVEGFDCIVGSGL